MYRKLLLTTALVNVTTLAVPAFAGCDTNTESSGSENVTTCTGDPLPYSKTVDADNSVERIFIFKSFKQDQSATNVDLIDITSYGKEGDGSNSSGVGKDGQEGRYIRLEYSGGSNSASGTNRSFFVAATGGDGHSGKDETSGSASQSGGNGGNGGTGGELGLFWYSGNIGTFAGGLNYITTGGDGGQGGEGKSSGEKGQGGKGGYAGNGGSIAVSIGLDAAVTYSGARMSFISTGGQGGKGGRGESSGAGKEGDGRIGGLGGAGGQVLFQLDGDLTMDQTSGQTSAGLVLGSIGGDGGNGGNGGSFSGDGGAGDGEVGGVGRNVTFQTMNGAELTFSAAGYTESTAIYAVSAGGNGGHGGDGSTDIGSGKGGDGASGAAGGTVSVTVPLSAQGLTTTGQQAQGIFAQSVGGIGGDGGKGSGGLGNGKGGGSGQGGIGGDVTVDVSGGPITTKGDEANAIFAQSVGGFAGDAGASTGFEAYGADGESGGNASTVDVGLSSGASIATSGDYSAGILAQAIGGGGGRGSSASGVVALGGDGSSGGNGGAVGVTTADGTSISTQGQQAFAIEAQSTGGSGGSSGSSKGIVAIGGAAGSGGDGSSVTIQNAATLSTAGDYADAVMAQSIGGGGGNAHSTSGIAAIGGSGESGGGGGDGGAVKLTHTGPSILTKGVDADGLFAQSIGGGGGSGSNAVAASVELPSVAVGGQGGDGGQGGAVTLTDTSSGTITTQGDHSTGVMLQSVGGGGGNGGYAISANVGVGMSMSVGAGGDGSHGGAGKTVTGTLGSSVQTSGDHAAAVQAQSIGGGGGNGGMAISSANSNGVAMSTAVGGSGGGGGNGGQVGLTTNGSLTTAGDHSKGVKAQSIGGGGGSSGMTIDANAVSNMSISAAVGRSGGSGGTSSAVSVATNGLVETKGEVSEGILAQSIGGNGGNAGLVVSATGSSELGAVDVGVGGGGGSGGNASTVAVTASNSVLSYGDHSSAIVAQSIGGGGGNGAMTISGSVSGNNNANVAIGGNGGAGGDAGDVTVTTSETVFAQGDQSIGILAQSIGGSGGNGGMSIAGSAFSSVSATASVSGSGGSGHKSGDVTVTSSGIVTTLGDYGTGIKAQSNGGGGGNATMSITGSASGAGSAAVVLGGSGGGGGTAGAVTVTLDAELSTDGDYADGVYAASQGGSGGQGATAVNGSMTAGEYSGAVAVAIGGLGGDGGTAGDVVVKSGAISGSIATAGYQSRGIFASSIGGHGGNGGSAYSGSLTFSSEVGSEVTVTVGGNGGDGGQGGQVSVTNDTQIQTAGSYSDAIFAQSIGGDGGVGGSAIAMGAEVAKSSSANFVTAVGGSGGNGVISGTVDVSNTGTILTTGLESSGIYAQSTGGGGGKGGNAGTVLIDATASQQDTEDKTMTMNVSMAIGGNGGTGRHGNTVTIGNTGSITVGAQEYADDGSSIVDNTAFGIFAQSVGGGGGDGGSVSSYVLSVSGSCTAAGVTNIYSYTCEDAKGVKTTYRPTLNLDLGGSGSQGGDGEDVDVENDGTVTTYGTGSHAVFAQSTGGGGGTGGYGALGTQAIAPSFVQDDIVERVSAESQPYKNTSSFQTVDVLVGGQGGSAGDAGDVTVINTGAIETNGYSADAIHAISTGGGGGSGGTAFNGSGTIGEVGVGGTGSGGGHGGDITVTTSGSVITNSIDSMAIFAQSVGGGGGRAGTVSRTVVSGFGQTSNVGKGVGFVLSSGGGGNGGNIDITVSGTGITTYGDFAHGIFAQSVGGSGGAQHYDGFENYAGSYPLSYLGSSGAGDDGNGGDITIDAQAPIVVSGDNAVAIFAQSVSGTMDTSLSEMGVDSGDITVTVENAVGATGDFSSAVMLQSEGQNKSGKISLTVTEDGSLFSAANANTIELGGGTSNAFNNYGTISKPDWEDGTSYVLQTFDTDMDINNYGVFEGSVNLSADNVNTFYNNAGGVLGLGAEFDLGVDASQLLNYGGTMSAATVGTIGTSNVDDQIRQSTDGTLWVDYTVSGSADLIAAQSTTAGAVVLFGTVEPNPIGDLPTDEETGSVSIVSSPVSMNVNSLVVTDTATIDYALTQTTGDAGHELVLSYDVNYEAWETEDAVADPYPQYSSNQNLYAVAEYLDRLVTLSNEAPSEDAGDYSDVAEFMDALIRVEDVDEVAEIYQHVTASDHLRLAESSLLGGLRFADNLMSCPSQGENGYLNFQQEGSCAWLQIGGQTRNADSYKSSIAFDENSWSLAAGAQMEIAPNWFLGGALEYESVTFNNSLSDGDGNRYHLGAVLKREIDDTTVAVSLSGGTGSYGLTRDGVVSFGPTSASDDVDNRWVALHGRVSHLMRHSGNGYVEPFLDIGAMHMSQDGVQSSAGLPIDINIGEVDTTQFSFNPGLEIGQTIDVPNGQLDLRLGLGLLSIVGDDLTSNVSVVDLAGTAGTFAAQTDFDTNFLDISARLGGKLGERTSFVVGLGALLGEHEQSFGGDFRLIYRF